MQLLQELNNTQGVTFIVVTHDLNVARKTNRIVVMGDGKIIREDRIGNPIEEDLRIWRHSGLGRRIISGEFSELKSLGFGQDQIDTLQDLFQNINQDD